jgi:2-methylcitrate dehydratase PrpD
MRWRGAGEGRPATTAGLGALLRLPVATIYQALNQAVLISHPGTADQARRLARWRARDESSSCLIAISIADGLDETDAFDTSRARAYCRQWSR